MVGAVPVPANETVAVASSDSTVIVATALPIAVGANVARSGMLDAGGMTIGSGTGSSDSAAGSAPPMVNALIVSGPVPRFVTANTLVSVRPRLTPPKSMWAGPTSSNGDVPTPVTRTAIVEASGSLVISVAIAERGPTADGVNPNATGIAAPGAMVNGTGVIAASSAAFSPLI